jgi:hypothetical protein
MGSFQTVFFVMAVLLSTSTSIIGSFAFHMNSSHLGFVLFGEPSDSLTYFRICNKLRICDSFLILVLWIPTMSFSPRIQDASTVELVLNSKCTLGESPIWDAEMKRLHFVVSLILQ